MDQIEEKNENQEPQDGTLVEKIEKKKINWILIAILSVVLIALVVWCVVNAINGKGVDSIITFGKDGITTLICGIFIISAIGYLIGSIEIKGVSLGTSGVFIVAIVFGCLFTIPGLEKLPVIGGFAITDVTQKMYNNYSSIVQNIGLVLFVASVGFIAGPKFFKNLKANAKSYVLLGIVIIMIGVIIAILFGLLEGSRYSVGILSGALTTTPGYSAAIDATKILAEKEGIANGLADSALTAYIENEAATVTLGHAIAYPFGVIGVVLFVQLVPKFMKADMSVERELLIGKVNHIHKEKKKKFFECDPFGLMPFAIAVVCGLLLGGIKIPLTGSGYSGTCFSLGTTGGVLIMCLIFGHFGHIGNFSFEVPKETAKVFREFGLMLFLIGAGVSGGVALVLRISAGTLSTLTIVYGFIAGILMTLCPMIVGFFFAKNVLKVPLLNNLGSITGGMTSTPALGTLVKVSETDDVASAYASTYPIALLLVVIASNLIITLV